MWHEERMATDPSELDENLRRVNGFSPEERDELVEELRWCNDRCTNGDQLGRRVLDDFCARGLVGSVDDAPAEWSTNLNHMEGFLGKVVSAPG